MDVVGQMLFRREGQITGLNPNYDRKEVDQRG